jgi:peptide/nickel transport system permease protein
MDEHPDQVDEAEPLAVEVVEETVEPGRAIRLPRASTPGQLIGTGLAAIAVGVIALYVSMGVLTDTTAEIRIAVAAVGLVAAYFGIDRIGRARFGPGFEADLWLACAWIVLIGLAAIFADLLPVAEAQDISKTLRTESLKRPDLFSEHPLGTDRQGLDVLGGIIYGARVSLVVSLGAVLIGMVIGGSIGIAAGYYRGKADAVVNLFTDSMLAFPPLILLLGMVTILTPNVRNVTLALAFLGIPTYVRLARANTMVFAQREFVLAAKGVGERNSAIMRRELLPNVLLPILSYGFIVVAVLIVAEASLSFLGLSIKRPTPTWGNMIAAGQADFERHPHVVFIPGGVLFLTVFCFNRIGDKARDLWTPQQK